MASPQSTQTFEQSAQIYDAVYAARGKSYRSEAAEVRAQIELRGIAYESTLLDVACGTGEHLRFLEPFYEATGLDASSTMLDVARRKLPEVTFHQDDMSRFSLESSFDVITCLFSAIGYLPDEETVAAAIARMADHLRPCGIILIEPGLTPERVAPAVTSTMSVKAVVDGREVAVTRTTSATREPAVLRVRFDYELTPSDHSGETVRFVEFHPMLLLSRRVYLRAFHRAGLSAEYVEPGLSGIGLYLGFHP